MKTSQLKAQVAILKTLSEHINQQIAELEQEIYNVEHPAPPVVKKKEIKLFGYSSDTLPIKELPKPGKPKAIPRLKDITPGIYVCCYCETPLTAANYSREHLIPRVKGGPNSRRNLRPCCVDCNQEKGNMYLNEYIGFLLGLDNTPTNQLKIANAQKLLKAL